MSQVEALAKELLELPEDELAEVFDFVGYLKHKAERSKASLPADITLASEQSLAKSWLTPQEDAAWAHL
jgi:hypothetical protein